MKFNCAESLELLPKPQIGIYDSKIEARRMFKFMKSANSPDQLWSRSIPFQGKDFDGYYLAPISLIHLGNTEIMSKLMELRNFNIELWPDTGLVSLASTSIWLENLVLRNEDRILFLVFDSNLEIQGHLGIWLRDGEIFEIDNVIKDQTCETKGIFSYALRTLCLWFYEFIGECNIQLRVLDKNKHAINFYKKNEFLIIGKKPFFNNESQSINLDLNWIVMQLNIEAYTQIPEKILTAGPSIGPIEISLVSDAVRNGWNLKHSDYLNLFSDIFSEYTGAKYNIPTDSCTSALYLSLWASGIGPGDEVIVPEITWVATASVVKLLGAEPIFAEINPETWTIDVDLVENLISEKTKAIIPVHLYGFVAELVQLEELCKKYNIKLIQDAAPGIGSMLNSKSIATRGDFTCFSFQGAKLLVTGEGGMLTTNNEELFKKAFKISDSGRRPGTFWIEILGKKMKMNNITAALGVAQMYGVERQIEKKRLIGDWYHQELSEIPEISMQKELANSRSVFWMSSIHISDPRFNREELQSRLKSAGIDTRPVFPPISQYPIWGKEIKPKPKALRIGENSLNLPSGVNLSRSAVKRICGEIKKYMTEL